MMWPSASSKKNKGPCDLLQELSDDEDDTMVDVGLDMPDNPQHPWLHDYHAYMDVFEQVPEGWTVLQWWGIGVFRLNIQTRD